MYSLVFMLAIAQLGSFQSSGQENASPEKPFIEVVGTVLKEVSPDIIIVSVGLSERTNSNNQHDVETQESSLKAILSGMNIGAGFITLSDAGAEIVKERRRDAVVKYSRQYTIELHSANEVSQLFNKLNEAGIKEAAVVKVEHSKIDSLRKEVRILAIKAAKDKAEYLTAAVGEHIGRALEIHEQVTRQDNVFQSRGNFSLANNLVATEEDSEGTMDFKKIRIEFAYFIKYSLR